MTYHEEQKARRAALKINSQEEYIQRVSELEELRSLESDDDEIFESIRDLNLVTGDWEYKLKEELKERLNNPEVGMYANYSVGSDCFPCEIVEIKTENKIIVRVLDAVLDPSWKPDTIVGGFAGHTVNNNSQRWIYTTNFSNETYAIRRNKWGQWKRSSRHSSTYRISLTPCRYYDFNF